MIELAQLWSRLDAELAHEHPAGRAIESQRLRLPAIPVEGQHELLSQPLAMRVGEDQALQLAHDLRVATECEQCVDTALLRRHPQLVQASDLALGERDAGESRKGLAPPEREGAPDTSRARIVAARERTPAGGHEAVECVRVHLPGVVAGGSPRRR